MSEQSLTAELETARAILARLRRRSSGLPTQWEIDEYGLPTVPCMVGPHDTLGIEFTKSVLDELRARAPADWAIRWALETIAALQELWYLENDKLAEIQKIIDRGRR